MAIIHDAKQEDSVRPYYYYNVNTGTLGAYENNYLYNLGNEKTRQSTARPQHTEDPQKKGLGIVGIMYLMRRTPTLRPTLLATANDPYHSL